MRGICRVGWRLFAVAMAVAMCVGMWGCSDWFPEDGKRSLPDITLKEMRKLLVL
ncbi:MAG: hypothetical protein MJZ22_05845 [Candidatus Saccharibacteria bacterium]|nr:hypothetical protein [Candidatus Saccharibacteria bacterium]